MVSHNSGYSNPDCWCSDSKLVEFSESYLRCTNCETLVRKKTSKVDPFGTPDDLHNFYSERYWFEYQRDQLGLPDITERAVSDLPERCLYWLKHLLSFRLPPGKVLELGCGHGGSVALMNEAGFEAIGMEMSPWVVNFAQRIFNIPVLQGPLENVELKQNSFDVIAAFDVLEHLPDPAFTMSRCAELLRSDGILMIQTPKLPEGKTYRGMVRQNHRFLPMFKEQGHLYLFSRRSIVHLLENLSFNQICFLDPLFPSDMVLVASRQKLRTYTDKAVAEKLLTSPSGRIILAMLTLHRELTECRKMSLPLSQLRTAMRLVRKGRWSLLASKVRRRICRQ